MKSYLLLILVITSTLAEKRVFLGYSVYKVIPKSNEDVRLLNVLQENSIVEYWNDQFDVNHDVRTMVSEDNKNEFLARVKQAGVDVKEVIPDLQKLIDQGMNPKERQSRDTSFLSFDWDRYHSLEEIDDWLDELVSAYPSIVSPIFIGNSFEGREIRGIKINYHPERNGTKFGVLEGTIHAREWISPATVTWIIKEFLTSSDSNVRAMAENLEWHIIPVVNPDGYEYTFTHNRMWRKNRSTQSFTSCNSTGVDDDMSNGVDLNRNFDFAWMSIGASDNPCSNTFAGPSAMSEPETRAISQYILQLKNIGEIIYYISFHSYTQLIIIPYSNITMDDVLIANNYGDMYEIAIRSAKELEKRYGTTYRVGISSEVLYPMSGGSMDWVKYAADVPVAYLIELRDLGEYGFLLPPEQIVPNNLEIMDALLEMDRMTKQLGYYYSGTLSLVSSGIIIIAGLIVSLTTFTTV